MKKKWIFSIFFTLVMCSTAVLFVPTNKGTNPGLDEESVDSWAKIDHDYMMDIIEDLSYIGQINDKGKEFGTIGERDAAYEIEDWMDDLELYNVHREQIDETWTIQDTWDWSEDPYIDDLNKVRTPSEWYLEISVYDDGDIIATKTLNGIGECFPLLHGLLKNIEVDDCTIVEEYTPGIQKQIILTNHSWEDPYGKEEDSGLWLDEMNDNWIRPYVKGFIVVNDQSDVIFMSPSFFDHKVVPSYLKSGFSIYGSDGAWIRSYLDDYTVKVDIKSEWDYEYRDSYNVIGQINGESDEVILIGSHYDCWWNQGAIDENAAIGTVLGIAKYFKDNDITPKYTLKFAAFAGEEWGYRGSKEYIKNMDSEEIKYMICPGNYGHETKEWNDQTKLKFNLSSDNVSLRALMYSIALDMDFEDKTDTPPDTSSDVKGEDCYPFSALDLTDGTIKFSRWPYEGYHCGNDDRTKGDITSLINSTSYENESELILGIVLKLAVEYSENLDDGWNLVSLPVNESIYKYDDLRVYNPNPDQGVVKELSWSDAVSAGWISDFIFGWNEDIQSYVFANTLLPGRGYWVYASVDCTLNWTSYSLVDNWVADLKNLNQESGWYMVGLPFDSTTDKEDLIINYLGTEYSWNDAVANGHVNDYIFGWDREQNRYCFADTLYPGHGYWIYANVGCSVFYDGPQSTGGQRIDCQDEIWNTQISITDTYNHNTIVNFGEHVQSSDGNNSDYFDIPAPPSSPANSSLKAFFDDNRSIPYHQLYQDFRLWPSYQKTWNLTVQYISNNQSNTTVILTWNISHLTASEYDTIRLYDNTTETIIDMLTQAYYQMNMTVNTSKDFKILCSNGTLPLFENVTASPSSGGFGENITISADVSHLVNNIDTVKVNVTYPDNSTNNSTMSNTNNDTYQYGFDDTWQTGTYHYYIWANDTKGNTSYTKQYDFTISANASMQVCTVKNTYTGEEYINLTDPPTPSTMVDIGYELLNDDRVLHMWNTVDSYYFNTSSGIQLTNHFDEYWSHNVLMLGYYNNDNWNLIYRTDELSGFQKTVDTDNQTFVNATLWKDLSYQGYEFRLALRYHLGLMDNELTVIPYIENLGEPIPYNLGFAWEINDIKIDDTPENDYILINDTYYWLNESLDLSFTNLTKPVYCWNETLNESVVCGYEPLPYFHIQENLSSNRVRSLYLRWNPNLNYKVWIQSRNESVNAPVVLGVRIGSLDAGECKQTSLYWYDADQQCYYFNDYSIFEAWTSNPGYMVDNDTGMFATTSIENDVEKCTGTSCPSIDPGSISKVEIRAYAKHSGYACSLLLRPVFRSGDGDDHVFELSQTAGWSDWFDVTDDSNAPDWNWEEVAAFDCDVQSYDFHPLLGSTVYCGKVEIRVTYTPWTPPSITNPTPGYGSTNVSIQPRLGITVTDDNGDTLDISWLSNCSGSWQQFATNNSVENGTYYQTMNGANVNGQWWYWMLNVSDDHDYNLSSVFKFYTGTQSKLVNMGTTDIKGYLLMQAEFWNGTDWVVDQVVIGDSSPRCLNASEVLGLDTVFNGLLDTGDLHYGDGSYRVYAALCDPNDDVLVANDAKLEAWWTFELDLV